MRPRNEAVPRGVPRAKCTTRCLLECAPLRAGCCLLQGRVVYRCLTSPWRQCREGTHSTATAAPSSSRRCMGCTASAAAASASSTARSYRSTADGNNPCRIRSEGGRPQFHHVRQVLGLLPLAQRWVLVRAQEILRSLHSGLYRIGKQPMKRHLRTIRPQSRIQKLRL
jgi:hypothetical protein